MLQPFRCAGMAPPNVHCACVLLAQSQGSDWHSICAGSRSLLQGLAVSACDSACPVQAILPDREGKAEACQRQLAALRGLQVLVAGSEALPDAPAAAQAGGPLEEAARSFTAAALSLLEINLKCQAEVWPTLPLLCMPGHACRDMHAQPLGPCSHVAQLSMACVSLTEPGLTRAKQPCSIPVKHVDAVAVFSI